MSLPQRRLGRTNLMVSVLGYGARDLEGSPRGKDISDDAAGRVLNAALDAGINFFDTSIDYGRSEERIGRYIGSRRGEYFLATKAGCVLAVAQRPHVGHLHETLRFRVGRTWAWKAAKAVYRSLRPLPVDHVYTPENIRAGLEQSLRRLQTDYVDLLQFHGEPTLARLQEHGAIDTLLDLQREGKVRFIGASTMLPGAADLLPLGVFDALQLPYSAIDRQHEGVMARAAAADVGLVIRGAAGKGQPDAQTGYNWHVWKKAGLEDLLDGMTRTQFILRYTLSNPSLSTAIVGTTSVEHLQENVAAAMAGPLPPDVLAEANRRLERAGVGPSP
jgi:aryl-alcohol dehydrogenase-like predicted oxidoreductase